jgi:hypothetical protein
MFVLMIVQDFLLSRRQSGPQFTRFSHQYDIFRLAPSANRWQQPNAPVHGLKANATD